MYDEIAMELRHLHTFTAAAELQSFTRAAERLSLTQAAVSQHIAALEKEFGLSLFDRAGRSVAPTEAGQRFYDYARRILNLVEEARRNLAGNGAQPVRGTLRIAASTVPAECLLPDLLVAFRGLHPDVREEVIVSDSVEATRAVEAGEADLGLVGELPRSSQLSVTPVAEDELVLAVAPDHPLADSRRVTLKQLRAVPLIAREPGSGTRRCVEQRLEAAGVSPGELTVVMEVNSNDAIRAAVERGVGAAFLSRKCIARDIDGGRLVALPVQGVRLERQLYLLRDPGRIRRPSVRAFFDFITQWLAGEVPK